MGLTLSGVFRRGFGVSVCWLAGIAAVGVVQNSALAGSISASPMMLEMPAGQSTSLLEIGNRGGEATTVQVRVFAWSQKGDEDRLEPTSDLLVSPAAASVAAGDTQVIRMLLRHPRGDAEMHYRLVVDELPVAAQNRQVNVAFRLSLPVVIAGKAVAVAAALRWELGGVQGRQVTLVVRNPGGRYVRISQVSAKLGSGQSVTARPVANNPGILPGAERRWRLELPADSVAAGTLRVTTDINGKQEEQALALIR